MIADFFTKPLQGNGFQILSVAHSVYSCHCSCHCWCFSADCWCPKPISI